MSELNISKAHIIGLSQGGAIALQFALDNPDMVDKLVLVDTGGVGAKPPLLPFITMILLNILPSRLINWFFTRYLVFNSANRDPNHSYYSIEVLKGESGEHAFIQGKGAAVLPFSEKDLRQIQHETLIIWGENDQLFSVEHGEAAARLLPNAKFARIAEAGHLPMMDQPAVFNKVLLEFLDEQQ